MLLLGAATLQFDFTSTVELQDTLVFESGTGTDTVQLTNLGFGASMTFDVINTAPGNGNSGQKHHAFNFAAVDPSFDRLGSSFLFQTIAATGSNQGIAIKTVSVAPVPQPASLQLVLLGLGALVVARRRQLS